MNFKIINGEIIKPINEVKNESLLKAYDWKAPVYKESGLPEQGIRDSLWAFSCGYSMLRTFIESHSEKGIFCYYTTLLQSNQFFQFLKYLELTGHRPTNNSVYWELNYGTIWTINKKVNNSFHKQIESALLEVDYPLQ